MSDTERPDHDGIMTTSPDEGEVLWVHTAQILGETEGEKIDKYAKIRVVETRKICSVDTGTDQ